MKQAIDIWSTDVADMVLTHCPICIKQMKIDCSDMNRCPLALVKFKGISINPVEFAAVLVILARI